MKFDKSKILTVITADKLKEGQMGWINDYVEYLKSDIKSISPYKVFRTNKTNIEFPFEAEHRGVRRYFYPAPDPTYAERQAEWVKENNVKGGTNVRVTRTFTENEDGSCCWEHDDLVGMTGVVRDYGIAHHNLGVDMSDGSFRTVPYFALEVIKEPTYRPFKNAEEFKPYRDEWFVSKCDNSQSSSVKTLSYSNLGVILLREVTKSEDVVFDLCKWDEFFTWFVRENREPCGIKEEA